MRNRSSGSGRIGGAPLLDGPIVVGRVNVVYLATVTIGGSVLVEDRSGGTGNGLFTTQPCGIPVRILTIETYIGGLSAFVTGSDGNMFIVGSHVVASFQDVIECDVLNVPPRATVGGIGKGNVAVAGGRVEGSGSDGVTGTQQTELSDVAIGDKGPGSVAQGLVVVDIVVLEHLIELFVRGLDGEIETQHLEQDVLV